MKWPWHIKLPYGMDGASRGAMHVMNRKLGTPAYFDQSPGVKIKAFNNNVGITYFNKNGNLISVKISQGT
ncbi:hypothetical protein SLEP1_g33783 [Rubroshorea leprosula]|uniref:Uncharacterized protein n=1 Tax=Rubroshorea leprosula TaxID=152421 RepID=A0AAV5KHT8_9ROSI|nr:hypothetical protein SLEP1_g33783 [Rubroshorea leprosula]